MYPLGQERGFIVKYYYIKNYNYMKKTGSKINALFIIICILILWFIFWATNKTFTLVLWNSYNNKTIYNNLKVSEATLWTTELALLTIKKEWYWYSQDIKNTINNKSIILSNNPLNSSKYSSNKDILISYHTDWKVKSYSWKLSPLDYEIIPLFYLDDEWEHKALDISIKTENNNNKISWNIVSDNSWISWTWIFMSDKEWIIKEVSWWEVFLKERTIKEFLSNPNQDNNYLIIFNTDSSLPLNYELKSKDFFTKPKINITSLASIWDYKMEYKTILDNTNYLKPLNYSIYSK